MFRRIVLVTLMILSVMFGPCCCHEATYQSDKNPHDPGVGKSSYPQTKFIVISDIHYYDRSLGISGEAFQENFKKDRKLLALSEAIFATVVDEVKMEDADFVIIPGDLTKDGEEINHKKVIKGLKRIAATGKKVYVVPGNHDVANRKAVRYVGESTEPVRNISGDGFAEMYKALGYSDAIERDPNSLSYVAEPVDGLWLMALDSCRWKKNSPSKGPFHGGAFSEETIHWIREMLGLAEKKNKAVVAFMHHGLLEHYPSNERYYPQYLVKDHERISRMFAKYDVRMVFTGHFHAQDITGKKFKDSEKFVFDIETGSLVTYPCPYRTVTLSRDQTARIESRFVTRVKSYKGDFAAYAKDYVFRGTLEKANTALKGYRVSKKDMEIISPQIAEAYVAHLEGDEKKPEKTIHDEGVSVWGKFIILMQRDLIDGWWTDLPPGDNTLKIDLRNGQVAGQ